MSDYFDGVETLEVKDGYDVKSMKEIDKEFMRGFAWCMDRVDDAFADVVCDGPFSTILEKHVEEIRKFVMECIEADEADVVLSICDSYEEDYECGEEN